MKTKHIRGDGVPGTGTFVPTSGKAGPKQRPPGCARWRARLGRGLFLALGGLLTWGMGAGPAAAQSALSNGASEAGSLVVNTTNAYSFAASAGDNVVLRLGTTGFSGFLVLHGPDGALLKTAASGTDAELDYSPTNGGTFNVQVSSYYAGGSGTYVLHLAQFPESFGVPAGDEGGAATNGANLAGTISLGDLDAWSFTVQAGDSLALRLGTTGFDGWLSLYGPDGALLKSAASGTDAELDYVATNSGSFTALVRSYYSGGVGTYVLHLAQFPESFIVPPNDEGGMMTNGGNHAGTITLGDLDLWSFTAQSGDNLVLRLGTTGFDGFLSLYGPDGALLKTAASGTDAELDYTATNSGTFTALVRSYYSGDVGTYVLHLAQFPEPFMVPPNDQGGPLTNGATCTGSISLGDLDQWAFTAQAGDNLVLRLGTTGFDGYLSLYGPDGALLKTGASATDAQIVYTATNSGTFTALARSYYSAGVGTYVLNLAHFPGAFVVSPGDEGGPMTNSGVHLGTITLGDEDLWSFTACAGDSINLQLVPTNFTGVINLYGPTGLLLKTATSVSAAIINFTATNCGSYSVLVNSYYSGGTGTYGLTAVGLTDGLKLCFPAVQGSRLVLNGIGGVSNAVYRLYMTTNVTLPFDTWASVYTNQFDRWGVFGYTNQSFPASPQRYFRLSMP